MSPRARFSEEHLFQYVRFYTVRHVLLSLFLSLSLLAVNANMQIFWWKTRYTDDHVNVLILSDLFTSRIIRKIKKAMSLIALFIMHSNRSNYH